MDHISELTTILKSIIIADKRRLHCLASLLIAILSLRTVNLKRLSLAIPTKAKPASAYRRLQRLLSDLSLKPEWVGCCLLSCFYTHDEPIYLTMDRTNWKFGKANINLLVVGATYKRMAIPLVWVPLNKQGSSSTGERIALLNRLFHYLPKSRVKGLLCDREFVGKEWFGWLKHEDIPFYIRIKHNYLAYNEHGKEVEVEALFFNVTQKRCLPKQYNVLGHDVYLTGGRSPSGELMIIASNKKSHGCAIDIYLERWEIEILFQNLKSRGFYFEDTHITDIGKIQTLMSILAIVACWAYRTGQWLVEEKEQYIEIKKHGRPAVSLFRHGLDYIQRILLNTMSIETLKHVIDIWHWMEKPKQVYKL